MSDRVKTTLTVAEVVILGPAAAILVLGVIPDAFGIHFCVGVFEGVSTNAANNYFTGFATATILSWLALIAGTVAAFKRGLRNFGTALPPVWFVLLVASSLVVATAIGSQPCQGGGLF